MLQDHGQFVLRGRVMMIGRRCVECGGVWNVGRWMERGGEEKSEREKHRIDRVKGEGGWEEREGGLGGR